MIGPKSTLPSLLLCPCFFVCDARKTSVRQTQDTRKMHALVAKCGTMCRQGSKLMHLSVSEEALLLAGEQSRTSREPGAMRTQHMRTAS